MTQQYDIVIHTPWSLRPSFSLNHAFLLLKSLNGSVLVLSCKGCVTAGCATMLGHGSPGQQP